MDRPTTRMDADARSSGIGPHEAFILPSRRPALELCRPSPLDRTDRIAQPGPILVTGDAGVGKSWLWRRLEAEALPSSRWIAVDLTPNDDPDDFYRLLARELGLVDLRASRIDLVELLSERQADGERFTLVIEEAHNLSTANWEEVRVLANRLDRPGGFATMMLVGQTSLARRFSTRPFASIEARLAARVHLGPIDVDEAMELLVRLRPGFEWTVEDVEARHRDAAGNPRRMIRDLGRPDASDRPRLMVPPDPAIESTRTFVDAPVSMIGPGKPPIRVEDDMIEVGWSPEDAQPPGDSGELSHPGVFSTPTQGGEEAVLDHYAALQAWQEWSDNQARRARPDRASTDPMPDAEEDFEEEEDEPSPPPLADRPKVWAEGEQKFAPFGQLFSRMAQAREPR